MCVHLPVALFHLFAHIEGFLASLAALVAAESTLDVVVGRLGLGGDLIFFLENTAPIPAGLLARLPTALARRATGRTGAGPGLRPRGGPGLVGMGRRGRPRPGLRFGLLVAAGSLALTLTHAAAAGSLALSLSLRGRIPCVRIHGTAAAGSLALALAVGYF